MCSIAHVLSWIASLDAPSADGSPNEDDPAAVLALRRLVERAQVAYLRRLAAVDAATAGVICGEDIAGLVAREVGLPVRVVHGEVRLARSLHTDRERRCEGTRAALDAGTLSTPQAAVIARAMGRLPPADVRTLEPSVAASCERADPSATDQITRQAILLAGDGPAVAREERMRSRRFLHVTPADHMVVIEGMLPAVDGAMVTAALDALAQPTAAEQRPGGARRSRPQLMADALTELARRQLDSGGLPSIGGVRPNVHVTVDLDRLLARTGTARVEGRAAGSISATTAARLGCDAGVDWSVHHTREGPPDVNRRNSDDGSRHPQVDPAVVAELLGQVAPALGGATPVVLAAGRTTRLVTAAQRKALIHRDKGCRYPGCDRPPEWCDAHHLREWARDRGDTNLDNAVYH